MKRRLLRLGLRRSAYGRFLSDTFYTPTLYPVLKRSLRSLDELEQTLLPLLLPHPKFSPDAIDLADLESNIRFRSWAREVYLSLKYGSDGTLVQAESELRALDEPHDLGMIQELFGIDTWNRSPDLPENAPQIALVKAYEQGEEDQLRQWTLEQALECLGCVVVGLNAFNVYCERHGIFELFSREYIDALSDHLIQSAVRNKSGAAAMLGENGDAPLRVLEVGAGSGKLSAYLQRALESKGQLGSFDVHATDSGTWRIKPEFAVQKISYQRALAEFQPHVVLCSWMPSGDDWTAAFRSTPSVQEYILIGEVDDGCCGHPWLTWGVSPFAGQDSVFEKNRSVQQAKQRFSPLPLDIFQWLGSQSEKAKAKTLAKYPYRIDASGRPLAPYRIEGFARKHIEPASSLQLCRYDRAHYACNSRTISFTRKKPRLDDMSSRAKLPPRRR